MRKLFSLFLSLALLAFAASPALAATVIITGNTAAGFNQPGWLFNFDPSNTTPIEFNTDQHSIGVGSLYVQPIGTTPAAKFIGENFLNTPIANVNSISFDFLIGNAGQETQEEQFYMNVYANYGSSDDLKYYDCRYDIVATVGSKSGFTTVTFDPTQSYTVTTRNGSPTCPAIPAQMNNQSQDSNIRSFTLNMGDTSNGDEGLDGYFDNVIVNLDSGITTYDFEPFIRSASITSPVASQNVTGVVNFTAYLHDDDIDPIQWAVRKGTCASGTNTVFGNVDLHSDVATINQSDLANQTFSFAGDMSIMDSGMYCFIYNPLDDSGETDIRKTVEFNLIKATPTNKDECKKGGWETFSNPHFNNQSECITFVQAPPKIDVCHREGTGEYHLINISLSAQPEHIAHGDGLPGSNVPEINDKKFANDCSFVDRLTIVETVIIPANRDISTLSNNPLLSGTNYILKARGTADAGDGIEFDARYSFRIPTSATWTDAVSTYEGLGAQLLDLYFNGTTPWGVYSTSHEYEANFVGTGAQASFMINDAYYPNNTGNLYVDIFRVNW